MHSLVRTLSDLTLQAPFAEDLLRHLQGLLAFGPETAEFVHDQDLVLETALAHIGQRTLAHGLAFDDHLSRKSLGGPLDHLALAHGRSTFDYGAYGLATE